MTAIKAADVDRFIAKPDPRYPVILVYGPDAGLVRERVDALVKASIDDANDPFSFVRIEGEDLSGNPSRLIDEAHTVPMFGGRRCVLVKAGSRNIAGSVELVINSPSDECPIIIEAGDLKKTSPLRTLVEKSKSGAALPCYVDNGAAVGMLVDAEMRDAQLTIAPDARATLVSLLGGDRMASRNEIRKLAMYARGQGRVELADVIAVVADASALALDGVIDSAFAGVTRDVETEFNKARAGGSSPAAIISAAIRQVSSLHKMRLTIDDGQSAETAMKYAGPPVHFTRQKKVGDALRIWSPQRLVRTMELLAEASLEARRNAPLSEAIAQRTLLSIASNARRRD